MVERNNSGNFCGALVVYDLDHTLTRHDTYIAFLLSVLRARPYRLIRCAQLVPAVAVHKLALRDNTWLKIQFLWTICGGCDRQFIEKIADRFAREVVPRKIRPGALLSIRSHQARGDQIVLATASLDIYVEAIAKQLGIASSNVVSTRAEWHDDRLTGRLNSPNLYGQAKADAVAAWMRDAGRDILDIAYSDHHSDLPLLQSAVRGVAVNPTDRLRSAACNYRFEVVQWNLGGEACADKK